MYLSGLFLIIFIINIVAGAIWSSPFLSDVGEALLLFGAVISFAVMLIRSENKKPQ